MPTGDGGDARRPGRTGRSGCASRLGKLLRIDVRTKGVKIVARRPAQPVASVDRPQDGPDLDRRRRPGRPRGDRRLPARHAGPRELRLAALRGHDASTAPGRASSRGASTSDPKHQYTHGGRRLRGHRRLRLPRREHPAHRGPVLLRRLLHRARSGASSSRTAGKTSASCQHPGLRVSGEPLLVRGGSARASSTSCRTATAGSSGIAGS